MHKEWRLFQRFAKTAAANGRAALTWHGDRALIARASRQDGQQPRLDASLHRSGHDGSLPALSAVELGGAPLSRTPLSAVMPEGDYQLLLEELPNAPREEMRSALSWRIRDRIDVPLDEAVIEILEMPSQARAAGTKTAYAVVAKREDVEAQIARVRTAGLALDTVDLPEMCMRNVAVRLPQDHDGVALLHFTAEHGLLTITRQGVLYLIRRIDIGHLQLGTTADAATDSGLVSSICLELQRSFDYYETHFDLPSVSELVLGPGTAMASLQSALAAQLAVPVSGLDLDAVFDVAGELDEDARNDCLFAAGAALRPDAASGWDA